MLQSNVLTDEVTERKRRRILQNRKKQQATQASPGTAPLSTNSRENIDLATTSLLYFPFLRGIKEEAVRSLHACMVDQKYGKREYIYLPYEDNDRVYFIKHGNVEIGYLDQSGRELAIDILGPGEIFGSVFGKTFSTAFARSVDKCVVGILNRNDFETLLERYPRFAARILKMMSRRLNTLEVKLQNLVFADVKTRICRLLYALYEKSGDSKTGQIRIPLTHQDIANLVASSRETASLHLSELKKEGVIAYERKRIRIVSVEALRRHMANT